MCIISSYRVTTFEIYPSNISVYEGVQVYGTKKLAEQHVAEIVYNQVDLKAEANAREGRISAARQG